MHVRTRVSLVLFIAVLCALPASGVSAPVAGAVPAAADTSGTPPQDAAAYISEGKSAVAGQNWTEALIITTKGLAWYPDDPELLCVQGYAYLKIGQYQRSVDQVSRAIPLDPRAVRYANRGYGYLALGNYTAALADAESGIAQDAEYSTSYGVKALALQGMGKNQQALDAIDTALGKAPDSAHYWHVKGRILASMGDCSGATSALEKSLAIDPGYSLPYPSFGSAGRALEQLRTECPPVSASPSATTPKASAGAVALPGLCLAAALLPGLRR
ncbi:MAG: tetratricopeptide repeat protein [Methanomicrobiales archaeon]|nr:tetratricopeptide repeat protein [Methanomicrobiales archaeon]